MTDLTLAAAQSVAQATVAEARAKQLNPLAVAVLDAGGNLKFALREDGSGIAGIAIAAGKARAALTFGCTSRQITDALAGNALAGQSVLAVLDGLFLMAGGVLLFDAEKKVIGAIGASGDTPDNDEVVVLAASATPI